MTKMAICGHQFRSGDESDWVSSTSASCLIGGSETAKNILEDLFRKREITPKANRIRSKEGAGSSDKIGPESIPYDVTNDSVSSVEENEGSLVVKKIPEVTNSDSFDETQHLNGCPVKWLYNKKLLEKNKKYRVSRWCSKQAMKKEEMRKERNANVRDRTPVEVKIHKINLIEKYTCKNDENLPSFRLSPSENSNESEELESRRKILAAKLNWKLHDESKNDCEYETSSEISSLNNYLPPRPLLGIKPLLSILMLPCHKPVCCVLKPSSEQSSKREERRESASLSIKSLDLPVFIQESKPRPRTTNTPRWGSKSTRLQKQLQVPNQVTISLRQTKKVTERRPETFKVKQMKKLSEKSNEAKSLSYLFYELSSKTNNRNQSNEYFREMIRDLTMDEDQFKIKRFLAGKKSNDQLKTKENADEDGNRISQDSEWKSPTDGDSNLICGKARFFEKLPRLKNRKGGNTYKH